MRIAFGLLDVGGDGVLGRRDVFAALAATTFEEMEVFCRTERADDQMRDVVFLCVFFASSFFYSRPSAALKVRWFGHWALHRLKLKVMIVLSC